MIITQDRENFWMLNWLDEFMIGHKGFICGGCFKDIFSKEKVRDLDIFFENEADWEEAVEYFDSMTVGYNGEDKREEKYRFYYENVNVKAYKHLEKGIVVELCCKIYGTPKQILEQFDFTLAKFAYYKAEIEDETGAEVEWEGAHGWVAEVLEGIPTHIEYKVMHDDKFFEHLHLKRLVTDDKILFPMSTFERMLKYAKYGYFPCRETKLKIIKALREVPENQIELSQSLYNGMD